jgi:hypothetical protein
MSNPSLADGGTPPMNERIKNLWLEALRSGEFSQARETLFDGESYCCLGVLCELHQKENGGEWDKPHYAHRYLTQDAELPPEVQNWAGLSSQSGKYGPESEDNLIICNDERKMSFAQIADIIEEKF